MYFECVKTLLKTKLKLFKKITIVSFEILLFNKSIYWCLYFVFIWYHMHYFLWQFYTIIYENLDKYEVQCVFKRILYLNMMKKIFWLYGRDTLIVISKINLYRGRDTMRGSKKNSRGGGGVWRMKLWLPPGGMVVSEAYLRWFYYVNLMNVHFPGGSGIPPLDLRMLYI